MARSCYLEARIRQFEAAADSFTPVLRAGISLRAKSGGTGESVDLGHEGPSEVRVEVLTVDAYLGLNPEGPGRMPATPPIARGFPQTMRTSTLQLNADWSAQYDLLFPLNPSTVSQIEENRAGGDAVFGITLRIAGVFRHIFPNPTPGGIPFLVPFVANEVHVFPHDSDGHRLEVGKSRWVERILPGLGMGKWMIYEIPVESFEGSAQVDTYLNNAVRQFVAGEWKLSMAAARDVVETLERELSADANPAFGDRFGSAEEKTRAVAGAYRDLVAAMLSYQSALKSLLAAGSHPERPEEFVDRPDAEMAVWTAMVLRRYVAMRLRQVRTPETSGLS